jgi:hypothetical protein
VSSGGFLSVDRRKKKRGFYQYLFVAAMSCLLLHAAEVQWKFFPSRTRKSAIPKGMARVGGTKL